MARQFRGRQAVLAQSPTGGRKDVTKRILQVDLFVTDLARDAGVPLRPTRLRSALPMLRRGVGTGWSGRKYYPSGFEMKRRTFLVRRSGFGTRRSMFHGVRRGFRVKRSTIFVRQRGFLVRRSALQDLRRGLKGVRNDFYVLGNGFKPVRNGSRVLRRPPEGMRRKSQGVRRRFRGRRHTLKDIPIPLSHAPK